VYSWIGGDRPSDVAKDAKEKRQLGFTAIKMNASEELNHVDTFDKIEAVVARVAAAREAVGSDFGIGVDFHGRVHKPMAKVLARELEPYHLLFIEEPVLPENNEALRDIAEHTSTPIATGERMYSRWDFKPLLNSGYVDIVQPDLSHAGGISEVTKIAAMAEARCCLAPHRPLSQSRWQPVFRSMPSHNAFIQEQSRASL
jgi:galactonate dehydratase